MRTAILAAFFSLSLAQGAGLEELLKQGRLFELRDAIARDPAPSLYRAAVVCGFESETACLAASQAALDTHPPVEIAIQLRDLRFDASLLRGRWQQALAEVDAEVALRGDGVDPEHFGDLCRAFLRHGSMTVERAEHTSVHVLYKDAHVPFQINGRAYRGFVDTGANLSIIAASAARALGLKLEPVQTRFGDASGKGLRLQQIAVADRFQMGNIVIRNFPFVVVPDEQEPFRSWGAGKRCVLGMQLLLAGRNMTWRGDFPRATFELARRDLRGAAEAAEICLRDKMILMAAQLEDKRLTLLLDTGAGRTVLHEAFAAAFPIRVENVPRKTLWFSGIGGNTSVQAAILPALTLRLGARDAVFRRIAIYLKGKGSEELDGQFGNDLVGKTHKFTLDFEAMRAILR